ncbi:carbamoyltransferase C-terminal domain-containing protein [Candidatus Accumulibacter sp. ACC003]|uniref:carbamoyltransferase C-terminal domain-containing protein n=1 Tax=Candidatus Accumulibacter sp. ACC003 TaxID=2823334 RepID=UPI0025C5C218|nr:carbamoyltransferase C-terminal domain-containing protein [Candidatus Accumulibacter sp. ACC003]
MYILGIHTGHDAGACLFADNTLLAFCKEERLNRVKNDGGFFDLQSVDEVLQIAGITRSQVDAVAFTRMKFPVSCFKIGAVPFRDVRRKLLGQRRDRSLGSLMIRQRNLDASAFLDLAKLRRHMDLRADVALHFCNHHRAHVLSSLRYCDWTDDVLLVSCDGGGDAAHYSAYHYAGQQLHAIWGGEETLLGDPQNGGASIGLAYAFATTACGFRPNRHEGKLTGLAAFGQPIVAAPIVALFPVDENGHIHSELADSKALQRTLQQLFEGLSKEDIAASIQVATEQVVVGWLQALLKKHPAKYIAMSGGVFSNVRLNQLVAALPDIDEVFVFPAMGDEGLPVGACVDYWVATQGMARLTRDRLQHLYYGRPYSGEDLLSAGERRLFRVERSADHIEKTAQLLADNRIGAIFWGAMEMGPRALGARSILASPARREVNDSVNQRLQRTEFMPFAPYVLDVDAERVYDIDARNRYACRFMTITTRVKPEWLARIPAVVHVDGTARPQIIERASNPLYYDILDAFKRLTGLPTLVNTSFNAHEEPIINTPEEALQALADDRIDFLVCEGGLVFPAIEKK